MSEQSLDYKSRGIAFMGEGKFSEAQEMFKKSLEIDDNSKVWEDLGNAYASSGNYDAAIQSFSKALLSEPGNGELYFEIGSVYLLQERLKKCIEYYNKAEEYGYNNVRLYSNLAAIYRALGDQQMELRNYTKAINQDPLRGELYVKKAMLLIEIGRPQIALETIEDLRKLFPDAFEGYDLAAQAYLALEKPEKALEILETGISRFPKDVNLMLSEIGILTQLNETERAEQLLAKVKESPYAELYRRNILLQEITIASLHNEPEKMKELLLDVVKLEDKKCDEQARFMLMMTANILEDYELAFEQSDILDSQETNSSFAVSGLYYKGEFLRKLGKEEEAKAQFKKAVRKLRKLSLSNRTPYEVYIYRAMAHRQLKEYEKAIEMAEFITELQPERPDGYILLADIYKDMGEEEKSNEQFAIAREKNPDLRRS